MIIALKLFEKHFNLSTVAVNLCDLVNCQLVWWDIGQIEMVITSLRIGERLQVERPLPRHGGHLYGNGFSKLTRT